MNDTQESVVQRKYSPIGEITLELWTKDGRLHRIDGAANRIFDYFGDPVHEEWRIDGLLHRLDGPAVTSWSPSGSVVTQEWWINGCKTTLVKIKSLNRPKRHKKILAKILPLPIYEAIWVHYWLSPKS